MNWTTITASVFPKDLASLPVGIRQRVEAFVFGILPTVENPLGLGKLEKLKGHDGYYKVRFGNYRLGLYLDARERRIHLLRVMHRRDIYRHFP